MSGGSRIQTPEGFQNRAAGFSIVELRNSSAIPPRLRPTAKQVRRGHALVPHAHPRPNHSALELGSTRQATPAGGNSSRLSVDVMRERLADQDVAEPVRIRHRPQTTATHAQIKRPGLVSRDPVGPVPPGSDRPRPARIRPISRRQRLPERLCRAQGEGQDRPGIVTALPDAGVVPAPNQWSWDLRSASIGRFAFRRRIPTGDSEPPPCQMRAPERPRATTPSASRCAAKSRS